MFETETATTTPSREISRTEMLRARRLQFSADFWIIFSFLGDAVAALVGLILGFWFRFKAGLIQFTVESGPCELADYSGLIGVGVMFLLATFVYLRVYEAGHLLRFRRVALLITKGATFWVFAYLGLSLALKFDPPISRIYVLSSYFASMTVLIGWRWIFHLFLTSSDAASHFRQRVIFLGWNAEAHRLAASLRTGPTHPYEVAGYLTFASSSQKPTDSTVSHLGTAFDLPSLLERGAVDIVILADLDPHLAEIVALANQCERHFVQFKVIPSYFEIMISGLQLETINGVPILGVTELALDRPSNRALKRCIDLLGALVGLIALFPILAICSVAIYMESPGSILFTQERIGRNGRRFRMYKLRTMKLGADREDHLNQSTLRNDPRLLKVGAFIRKWNLDETPQFWNVLKGEMSLVGPRPERTFHSEKLSNQIPHYNARYSTKPGLTGWAQVNGLRGDTSLMERIRYDLFYLENWSLWLDFQIMIQTFFKRENAY